MPKLPICPYCNQEIGKSQPQKTYKNKHYHSLCYKKMCEELFDNATKNLDSQQELYNYICKLFNLSELSPFLSAQLKKFENEYNMTYDGMWYSLKYYFEILGNPIDKRRGVGIVPYVYDEARNFYNKKVKLTNQKVPSKPKDLVVKISPKRKKPKSQININNL